jgi:hypothetical protein
MITLGPSLTDLRGTQVTGSVIYPCQKPWVARVNLTNFQDEGLRIGDIGHRMNSKVKISQTRHVLRINVVVDLDHSQSVPDRPLLAPIYRWPGLKEPVGSDTYYNVCFRHGLVL